MFVLRSAAVTRRASLLPHSLATGKRKPGRKGSPSRLLRRTQVVPAPTPPLAFLVRECEHALGFGPGQQSATIAGEFCDQRIQERVALTRVTQKIAFGIPLALRRGNRVAGRFRIVPVRGHADRRRGITCGFRFRWSEQARHLKPEDVHTQIVTTGGKRGFPEHPHDATR